MGECGSYCRRHHCCYSSHHLYSIFQFTLLFLPTISSTVDAQLGRGYGGEVGNGSSLLLLFSLYLYFLPSEVDWVSISSPTLESVNM